MLYRYSDFIKESLSEYKKHLYWNNEDFKSILNEDWTEIKVTKEKRFDSMYDISFRIGTGKYDVFAVVLDTKGGNDFYILNGDDMSKQFQQKFKTEFWKNASEYVKDMMYDPKCLGDVEHVRDAAKYNM